METLLTNTDCAGASKSMPISPRQPAPTSLNTTFTVKDFHVLFGKETIASPAINATLTMTTTAAFSPSAPLTPCLDA